MPDRLAPPSLRPAAREEILTALAAAADLGMFFRLPDPAREGAGWQPVGLLYAARQDHLDGLLASVRAALHDCEPRVAASLFFQGYASRLLSPQLACLAANGCVPGMSAARLAWRHPDDQVIELGLSPDAGWAADGRRLMEQLVAVSFGEHLAPLADALRLRVPMSPGLLRGNAAAWGCCPGGSGRVGGRWRPTRWPSRTCGGPCAPGTRASSGAAAACTTACRAADCAPTARGRGGRPDQGPAGGVRLRHR